MLLTQLSSVKNTIFQGADAKLTKLVRLVPKPFVLDLSNICGEVRSLPGRSILLCPTLRISSKTCPTSIRLAWKEHLQNTLAYFATTSVRPRKSFIRLAQAFKDPLSISVLISPPSHEEFFFSKRSFHRHQSKIDLALACTACPGCRKWLCLQPLQTYWRHIIDIWER